MFQISAF